MATENIGESRMFLEHDELLSRAVRNVLSTEIAEKTMAQLVDGLPIAGNNVKHRGALVERTHVLFTEHPMLCSAAAEKTRLLLDNFTTDQLSLDQTVSYRPSRGPQNGCANE
jgi:hypothetical protein